MWFPNEAEEQAIDQLLRELGIRLPHVSLDDDDASEPMLDTGSDYNCLLNNSIER